MERAEPGSVPVSCCVVRLASSGDFFDLPLHTSRVARKGNSFLRVFNVARSEVSLCRLSASWEGWPQSSLTHGLCYWQQRNIQASSSSLYPCISIQYQVLACRLSGSTAVPGEGGRKEVYKHEKGGQDELLSTVLTSILPSHRSQSGRNPPTSWDHRLPHTLKPLACTPGPSDSSITAVPSEDTGGQAVPSHFDPCGLITRSPPTFLSPLGILLTSINNSHPTPKPIHPHTQFPEPSAFQLPE